MLFVRGNSIIISSYLFRYDDTGLNNVWLSSSSSHHHQHQRLSQSLPRLNGSLPHILHERQVKKNSNPILECLRPSTGFALKAIAATVFKVECK